MMMMMNVRGLANLGSKPRQEMVAIILSILKCMFHSKSIKILQKKVKRLERQN